MSIRRLDPDTNMSGLPLMVPADDGGYVDYDDHEAEVEELRAVRRALVRDNRDKTNTIRELQARVQQLEAVLRDIASYDEDGGGCCPYGCDTPTIAKAALAAVEKRPTKGDQEWIDRANASRWLAAVSAETAPWTPADFGSVEEHAQRAGRPSTRKEKEADSE